MRLGPRKIQSGVTTRKTFALYKCLRAAGSSRHNSELQRMLDFSKLVLFAITNVQVILNVCTPA
jgi:hypothetical protein